MMREQDKCKCEIIPRIYFPHYSCFIGVDKKNGRYGQVDILKCINCNQFWLEYFVEYEAYSESGRWFIGKITEDEIPFITASNAVEKLANMDWYIKGGSYFFGKQIKTKGRLSVDC